MRRNIFTSYIICKRLNFEALFEPIIDFIEIVQILCDPFHIFRAPDTRMTIRRDKTISIKMTDPFSVLSIGSIITSHTLIFRKYRNK
ncbi:hypothetical protein ES319_A09G107900v1 [Gossypium barbadense]|uniref:Uncharacterized protein n=1 Tax=Gossypium barbadense TaxID=3634 RepID=A0A5J5UCK9_GOSBA|nr:hypothetical protein ES319_A09G107900v1 [Gossypium barbadense]